MPNIVSLRRGRAAGAAVLAACSLLAGVALVAPATPAGATTASAEAVPGVAAGAPPVVQAYGPDVTITGHGFGHGEGMGQWGAYGYATTYKWQWQQILAHYYGGTTFGTTDPNQLISVRLQALDDRPFTAIVQEKGLIATSVDGLVARFRSLVAVETATPGVYAVWGRADAPVCPNPAAPFDPTGWVQVSVGATSSVSAAKFIDVYAAGIVQEDPDPTNFLGLCQPDNSVIYYRGTLRPVNGSVGENRTVNFVGLDLYTRGVVPREMPASWGTAAGGAGQNALRVQAVAARSFAAAGGLRWPYAKICDSQTCQVYGGAAKRAAVGASLQLLEQTTTTTAVTETTGLVLRKGSAIASAMYASSTGGITSGIAFPSVTDLGDAVSPHHTWTVSVPTTTIEAKWPAVGSLLAITVTRRNGLGEWGGRVQAMTLRGTAGSVNITGDQFRIGLGLKSTWFFVPDGCAGPQGGTPVPAPAASAFQAVTPARVVDTRLGLNTPAAKVPAGCVLPVRLAGLGGVPDAGATAVTLNLTVVGAGGNGFATAYPCSAGRPDTSNANYAPGDVVANLVTVPLDGDGLVCVYTVAASDVLMDVMGWYGGTTASRFRSLTPVRLRDTRRELGGPGPVAAGVPLNVPVAGVAGVPPAVTAVALNLTVTRPSRPGFVTAYPCDSGLPPTSNANFPAGRTVANQVVVTLGPSGAVCLVSSAPTDLVVDLLGWYGPSAGPPGSLLSPLTPARVLDTRNAVGVPGTAPVAAGGTVTLKVTGRGGVASGAKAAILNVTAVDAAAEGYVTVFPCDQSRPNASNLNPLPGRAVPNHVMVPLSGSGTVCLFTSTRANLVADVAGSFA